MAKTKPGLFTKISGSVGGTQFRDTRYGTVIAIKSSPVKRETDKKQNSCARFSNASRLWAKVSPEMAMQWNALANSIIIKDKLGNIFSIRGIDLFKQVNRNLVEINEPVIFSAPEKIYPPDLVAPDFELIPSGENINIRLHFNNPIRKENKYIIFATRPMRDGRNSPKDSWFRKISVLDSKFISGSSLLQDYLKVFPYENSYINRVAFRIKPVSRISGLAAPIFEKVEYVG